MASRSTDNLPRPTKADLETKPQPQKLEKKQAQGLRKDQEEALERIISRILNKNFHHGIGWDSELSLPPAEEKPRLEARRVDGPVLQEKTRPQRPTTSEDIRDIISELGSTKFSIRQAASKKLLEMPEALDALYGALPNPDREISSRIAAVIQTHERDHWNSRLDWLHQTELGEAACQTPANATALNALRSSMDEALHNTPILVVPEQKERVRQVHKELSDLETKIETAGEGIRRLIEAGIPHRTLTSELLVDCLIQATDKRSIEEGEEIFSRYIETARKLYSSSLNGQEIKSLLDRFTKTTLSDDGFLHANITSKSADEAEAAVEQRLNRGGPTKEESLPNESPEEVPLIKER